MKITLRNDSLLKGRLLEFRDEMFILQVDSGILSIPKMQVRRLEFIGS